MRGGSVAGSGGRRSAFLPWQWQGAGPDSGERIRSRARPANQGPAYDGGNTMVPHALTCPPVAGNSGPFEGIQGRDAVNRPDAWAGEDCGRPRPGMRTLAAERSRLP